MAGRIFLEGGAVVTMDGPAADPLGTVLWPGTVVLDRGVIADVGPERSRMTRSTA